MLIINWITENKEWLFSGIITNIIFFFLGRKSVHWKITINSKSKKIIKGNGINNRTAEIYHEDKSTHIENKTIIVKSGHKINYDTFENLTLGASGCEYKAPANGIFYIKGLTGTVCINNKIEEVILPQGKQISVEKKDLIRIYYEKCTNSTEFKFYFYNEY